ncbi:hypothetical protein [Vibrio chagasii]|uniref:hypothetical protein n=1 Tax=Vibrio chagasii TaxID=170679 RepID=UPI0022839AFB|nr:hypothetical protein [Vibrio chagasii]MCY9826429.1 hypothetical protein [Vibrio chagasii]
MLKSKKRHSIFLLESPLQIKNSISIIESLNLTPIVILRLNSDEQNDYRIKAISETLECNSIKIFVSIKKSNYFSLLKGMLLTLLIALRYRLFGSSVFIGDYRSFWMKLCAYLISPFKLNIVDDGMASIAVVKKLEARLSSRKACYGFWKLFTPEFYSYFDMKTIHVKVNKFPSERHYKKRELTNNVFIVGSPLVEKGIITEFNWLKFMSDIVAIACDENAKIEYIPHRAESLNNIKLLREAYPKIFVRQLNEDIEDYIYQLSFEPVMVIGFYSTALVNLSEILQGTKLVSYELPESSLLRNKVGIIDVYDYLKLNQRINVYKN